MKNVSVVIVLSGGGHLWVSVKEEQSLVISQMLYEATSRPKDFLLQNKDTGRIDCFAKGGSIEGFYLTDAESPASRAANVLEKMADTAKEGEGWKAAE